MRICHPCKRLFLKDSEAYFAAVFGGALVSTTHRLCTTANKKTPPTEWPTGLPVLVMMLESPEEFGDLCTEVAGDIKDSQITDNELARVDRECGELIASVHALREALARRNQASKPAHLRAV